MKSSLAEYRIEIRDITLMRRRSKFWRFTLVISLILPDNKVLSIAMRGCLLFATMFQGVTVDQILAADPNAFYVKAPSITRNGATIYNVIDLSEDLSRRIIELFGAHGLLQELVSDNPGLDLDGKPEPSCKVPETIEETNAPKEIS